MGDVVVSRLASQARRRSSNPSEVGQFFTTSSRSPYPSGCLAPSAEEINGELDVMPATLSKFVFGPTKPTLHFNPKRYKKFYIVHM